LYFSFFLFFCPFFSERAAAGATLEAGQWRRLLLQYCQLDTLAMVMVWWHWRGLAAGQGGD